MRIVELEDRLKAAEDAAFEQEARAAQLEVELFDRMDGEQQRVEQMVSETIDFANFVMFVILQHLFSCIFVCPSPAAHEGSVSSKGAGT